MLEDAERERVGRPATELAEEERERKWASSEPGVFERERDSRPATDPAEGEHRIKLKESVSSYGQQRNHA